jgi:hypothetical protein
MPGSIASPLRAAICRAPSRLLLPQHIQRLSTISQFNRLPCDERRNRKCDKSPVRFSLWSAFTCLEQISDVGDGVLSSLRRCSLGIEELRGPELNGRYGTSQTQLQMRLRLIPRCSIKLIKHDKSTLVVLRLRLDGGDLDESLNGAFPRQHTGIHLIRAEHWKRRILLINIHGCSSHEVGGLLRDP